MPIPAPGPETRVYQPGELNHEVRVHLEAGFPRLWLAGEISNLSQPASGHWYFTLKDSRAQIRCALFRGQRANVGGKPVNGDQVLVRGRLSLYEPRGDYQLIADALLPAGSGALQQAFEALKNKLEAEGLFEPTCKQDLPRYPDQIAVVTSPSGAAIRDILITLGQRWPAATVRIHAAQVQGEQAVPSLIRALDAVEREGRADVIVLARGGGSLEDLWAFNDERLARRIHASKIPIVSGVGHETDITIADFVADVRAATPTAAAQAVTPDGPALKRQVEALRERLLRAQSRQLQQAWQRLDSAGRRLAGQHPARRLAESAGRIDALSARLLRTGQLVLSNARTHFQGLDRRLQTRNPQRMLARLEPVQQSLKKRLERAIATDLNRHANKLGETARALQAVSPLAVLARGYAIIEDQQGHVLSRRDDFYPGQLITSRVRSLRIDSKVLKIGTAEAEPGDDRSGA
ncbi:MAG: exodeoxyribonuclease VII large subunit [Wenzhouxiangellaceae bacterium]|nr:exodeoxyribonuclease VII large subunit [Wenzhouxiangellaceae bacterium]